MPHHYQFDCTAMLKIRHVYPHLSIDRKPKIFIGRDA
uniref:Uncharacterized protein n=1 Tax=Rhizophora mucronata TaxID=61149 RepID=A0A2P2PZ81_RHIMU